MCARTAIPCRIDQRVPSRDANSAGGLGSLDFVRCLTLIFLRLALFYLLSVLALGLHSLFLSPWPSTSPLPLVSPSSSLLSRRGLSYPSDSSVPLSLLPFPGCPSLPPLLSSSSAVRSECPPERRPIWRHRTKCVKAWPLARFSALAHAHEHAHAHALSHPLRARSIFNLPQYAWPGSLSRFRTSISIIAPQDISEGRTLVFHSYIEFATAG